MTWEDAKRCALVLIGIVFAGIAFILVCYAVSAILQAVGFV